MTFRYNSTAYEVMPESTYKEIIVTAMNLSAACDLVDYVDGMTSYEFNNVVHDNMVVKRKQINIEGDNNNEAL